MDDFILFLKNRKDLIFFHYFKEEELLTYGKRDCLQKFSGTTKLNTKLGMPSWILVTWFPKFSLEISCGFIDFYFIHTEYGLIDVYLKNIQCF